MLYSLRWPNILILLFSVAAIYLLAPDLNRDHGVFVSLTFALILILSSRLRFDRLHCMKYLAYIGIAEVTYFALLNDQPWDFLFGAGMFDASAAPLVFCSLAMSLAGGLLLPDQKSRILYVLITLGLQIPLAIIIGGEGVQRTLEIVARGLHYKEFYSGNWQTWQLEWMLTYYLPIYFLNHKRG